MAALKRVEVGFAVLEICRELGISSATFYKWRAKFVGYSFAVPETVTRWELRGLGINNPANSGSEPAGDQAAMPSRQTMVAAATCPVSTMARNAGTVYGP